MFNTTMVSKPNQAASNKQYTISKHLSITIKYQTVTTLTEERKKEREGFMRSMLVTYTHAFSLF